MTEFEAAPALWDTPLVPSLDESDAAAGLIGRVLDEDFGGPAVESLPIDSSSQRSDMSPDRFEAFVAAWYRAQGHEVVLTPYSGDGGIDVLAVKNGRISFIQAKHVGEPDRRIPDDAVDQVRNGASHYLSTYIPDGHSRSYSLVVATNGRASRLLKKSAVEHEVELIRGRDLVRSFRRSPIEAGEPTRLELSRLGSLEELTERVVPLLRQTT
ncbi:MAG: restriction endonuclease [bacterium]|nr:restriction endonuclease [bacterium]